MPEPILIVGAGPVGLSLAVALTRQGLPVEVFEALPDLSPEARASTFHPPTLEMFDEWGVIDPILAKGHRVDRLLYWERATQQLVAEFNYRVIARDTPYPFRLHLPQSEVTRLLKPVVVRSGYARVHLNHRLIAFVDHGDHVTATFHTPDGVQAVQGSYLCGTDGAHSTVRRQLNLRFDGLTYPDRFLLIASDLNFQRLYPGLGPVNYIFDPDEWVIVLHLPDVMRVMFQVKPEEEEALITQDRSIRERMARFIGANIAFTIKSVSLYSVHQRVAETFRVGRVVCAGDAVHLNNPAGSMGMNNGIHDAHALAAALTDIWRGGADTLLDEYSAVRRSVARRYIHERTHHYYSDMVLRDPAERQARNLALRDIAADPARAREYLLRASMLDDRLDVQR